MDSELLGIPHKETHPKDQPELRWTSFSNMGPEEMFEVVSQKVFPFIKSMGEKDSAYANHLKDAIFVIPTPSLLSRFVAGINDFTQVTIGDREVDTRGDLYEYLLINLQ